MRSQTLLRNTQPKEGRLKSPSAGGGICLGTVSERSKCLSRASVWKPRCLSALASREGLGQTRCWGTKPPWQSKHTSSRAHCHHWKARRVLTSSLYPQGCPSGSFPMHHQGLLAIIFFFFFFFLLNATRLQLYPGASARSRCEHEIVRRAVRWGRVG